MKDQYKISFTSASLFSIETIRVAEFYLSNLDWDLTKEALFRDNLIQRKKEGTMIRQFQEIRHRLKALTLDQLELLVNSNAEIQKLILFLGINKYYAFIREFTVEVVRQKFILFDTFLTDSDYYRFYEYKAADSQKLSSISDNTKVKIKRVTFTILWQSGLLNSVKNRIITQPFLTPRLIEVVVQEDPELLKVFLVSDMDIKNYIDKYGK